MALIADGATNEPSGNVPAGPAWRTTLLTKVEIYEGHLNAMINSLDWSNGADLVFGDLASGCVLDDGMARTTIRGTAGWKCSTHNQQGSRFGISGV